MLTSVDVDTAALSTGTAVPYSSQMPHYFTAVQHLPYPLETVFAFFADPANLPRLMPAWQDASIENANYIAPPPPPRAFRGSEKITAGSGTTLTLTVRPFPFSPVRLRWDALIEDFRWLEGFCDVQTKGPFATWRHCHTLRATSYGTHLTDSVTYALPLGPLGLLANALVIRHQIAAAFRYRQRRTIELLAKL